VKVIAGLLGALIGCVLGPLVGLPALSAVTSGPMDEGEFLLVGLVLAAVGAGVGLAVGVRLVGGRWPWWWGAPGGRWRSWWFGPPP
jgi:hypothetical protein